MRDSLPSKLTQRAVTNEDHSVSGEELPVIPAKRYFTIGEMAQLCAVKPHVLRYWEQEFAHLKPVKRRGNRCCNTRQDVLAFRRIRSLLYAQGSTITGAKVQLAGQEVHHDASQYRQLLQQTIDELEQLKSLLKRR